MDNGRVPGDVFLLRLVWETILNQFGNVCRPRICPRCEIWALSLGSIRVIIGILNKDLTGTPYRPFRGAKVGKESGKQHGPSRV